MNLEKPKVIIEKKPEYEEIRIPEKENSPKQIPEKKVNIHIVISVLLIILMLFTSLTYSAVEAETTIEHYTVVDTEEKEDGLHIFLSDDNEYVDKNSALYLTEKEKVCVVSVKYLRGTEKTIINNTVVRNVETSPIYETIRVIMIFIFEILGVVMRILIIGILINFISILIKKTFLYE